MIKRRIKLVTFQPRIMVNLRTLPAQFVDEHVVSQPLRRAQLIRVLRQGNPKLRVN
jgi:hypothetical protein